ncbi:glycine betaine/proline transport system ATP-binding protein [Desulfacinum hydrothermale DSM 13146]|uniref:Glycine betaine/proline transport system ATP-binding protein n=1 Tax=Desulfacinum hydrothermale DSM 13146 TaxID=1121390 RepID=A0A1W1XNU3_9BACT|nr:glycine betaine/L-proline ABC transporter ATP-binding protein [Desulfacinum hydrothermale]SMC25566.1 glycine betaine/proline transport system ATP-binding protein [Desulfacinum hydrothermale DSM 13146]
MNQGTDATAEKLCCRDVWKIFGKLPGGALGQLRNAPQRQHEIQTLPGCTVAVREADFSVREGELFVIMGLSGSGKSTLMRCLNGLIRPTWGEVFVDGRSLQAISAKQLRRLRQEKMAMVFQHFALLPHRTILDNVALGLELQGVSKKRRRAKALEALELVGLQGWERNHPVELSGGMQQRVGLARALAVDPQILLMDEPFSALDPLIRRQMQDEFLKLAAKVKKTIVFITHDLDEAIRLADRIAMMKDGRIVQMGTPEQIVLEPENDYVEEFVASVSRAKVITARHVMADPRPWTSRREEDPLAVLDRMKKEDLQCVFITDTDRRLLGVLTREEAARKIRGGSAPAGCNGVPAIGPDAPLSEVVEQAASSIHPTPVLDGRGRILGVVTRKRLLQEWKQDLEG